METHLPSSRASYLRRMRVRVNGNRECFFCSLDQPAPRVDYSFCPRYSIHSNGYDVWRPIHRIMMCGSRPRICDDTHIVRRAGAPRLHIPEMPGAEDHQVKPVSEFIQDT